jgi:outer membrane protein assembly factor BamB
MFDRNVRLAVLLAVFVSWLGVGNLAAENWARWRGPHADGSSATANPPLHWSEEQNVRWKVEIPGRGASTPIVWEDKVFILTAIPTDRKTDAPPPKKSLGSVLGMALNDLPTHYHQLAVICYDRHSGAEKWRSVAREVVPHEPNHKTNSYASYSPVTDGQHLFVSFGSHGVYCYDLAGNKIWETDLGKMETQMGYGEGSSPEIHDGTLVVPFDHEKQSFWVALAADSGEQIWRVDRNETSTWATPRIVEHQGRTQVIAHGMVVRGYDLTDGSLIWECGGQAYSPIPSPIVHDGIAYCMTGFLGNAVVAISLDSKGDVTGTDRVVWKRHDAAPYVPSAVLYKNRLYYNKSLSNIICAIDAASGETIFEKERISGIRDMYASPVAAADRVYFTGRDGTTVVIRHADQYEVLAKNKLDDIIDASPAIVDNEMFLRGEKYLYCIVEP